jgi:predicted flap endonuclease-1-like 5' DNA nuclease
MLGNIVLFVVGLIVGLLVAWLYWRGRISGSETEARRLKASVAENQRSAQNLRASLQEQEADVDRLKSELSQHEATILNLNTQIEYGNAKVEQLEGALKERDGQIADLTSQSERATARAGEMEGVLQEKEQGLQDLQASLREQQGHVERLQSQVSQREDTIRDLTVQIEERNQFINQVEGTVRERDDQLQALSLRAEGVEAKAAELKASLDEIELEAAATRTAERLPTMEPLVSMAPPRRDNLKRIEGIGPKISRLLNDVGITSFAQLAATDVKRLEQILSDAGMTLADPTTWPEQAELAAAGDWKTLEILQDELQGGRRVPRSQ